MTSDYGAGRRRKPLGAPFIIAGAVLFVVIIVVGSWLWRRPNDIRRAEAWAISGAPCPQVSAQAFQAQPVRIRERFEDDDITFGRGYGHASCDEIVNDGGRGFGTFTECQFNNPSALEVTTSAGTVYFLTGPSPATVMVKPSGVSCVLAGKYKGELGAVGE